MDQITLKNFRCFSEQQTASIAPLTLLVGENSTGKTSFLAMVRALWDVVNGMKLPDFKEDPYDLGSFDEVVHHRSDRHRQEDTFEIGFNTGLAIGSGEGSNLGSTEPYYFRATFGRRGSNAVPIRRCYEHGYTWIDERFETDEPYKLQVGTYRGAWEVQVPVDVPRFSNLDENMKYRLLHVLETSEFTPSINSPPFTSDDRDLLGRFASFPARLASQRPFAGAPIRSKPRRTYDPSHTTPDPEGDYIPMYLAHAYLENETHWSNLKNHLETFGRHSELFDEISIRPLGKRSSDPFQIQIRKSGRRRRGPWRNLIDVGYGVNQVLPVITELVRLDTQSIRGQTVSTMYRTRSLWRPERTATFLLQQPEIHLHPTAQAALGSLFCQLAGWHRQLIVETHSDYLLDRVRMDVRDGKSALNPDDVSILFFERDGLNVNIHSLRIDEEGNVLDAPDSYGRFFMEETTRSLWKQSSLL